MGKNDSNTKFTFDDILIQPNETTSISSRNQCNVYVKGLNDEKSLPLITAPMTSVVNKQTIDIYLKNNIIPAIPRNELYDDYDKSNVIVSCGFNDIEEFTDTELKKINYLLIDVANGHMLKILHYVKFLNNKAPHIKIIIGNIANPSFYEKIILDKDVKIWGARCGIGFGASCITSTQCGIGYPMASLINEIYLIKKKYIDKVGNDNIPKIIADGGFGNYSQIIKALALGADFVMLGSIFSTKLNSGGNYFIKIPLLNKKIKIGANNSKWMQLLYKYKISVFKKFYGMSTKIAQKEINPNNLKLKTSEGVVRYKKIDGTLDGWVDNFKSYLKSAMSYTNNSEITKFIGNVKFNLITKTAFNHFNK